jgi:hypothetical protein
MKSILLASALALGGMTTAALAGTATLTDTQLDGITAGAGNKTGYETTTTVYKGNSNNIACSGTCDATTAPEGWTSTSTNGPKGQVVNQDTTTCTTCSTSPRNKPGK